MTTQAEKATRFAALHAQDDAFVIPNPWDVGSALLFQGMGFQALATTSGGFAYAVGKLDGQPTLAEKLDHCRAIANASEVPLSADFEDGFAAAPEAVAENVRALIETGVAGCSIEDFDRAAQTMYDPTHAAERVAAAVEVVATLDFPFTLTARAEVLLRGAGDLDDAIARLQSFEAAGANALYAPYIASLDDIQTVASSIGKPLNVLAGNIPGATVADYQAAGAQRISIGGALTFVAAKPIVEASRQMLQDGTFDWVGDMLPYKEVMTLFANKP